MVELSEVRWEREWELIGWAPVGNMGRTWSFIQTVMASCQRVLSRDEAQSDLCYEKIDQIISQLVFSPKLTDCFGLVQAELH